MLQAVPVQLAGGAGRQPEVQGGRGQGHPQGRVPALVQRLPLPHAERREAREGMDIERERTYVVCRCCLLIYHTFLPKLSVHLLSQ